MTLKLTTAAAYEIYKERMTQADKDPVGRKSFERYLRKGTLVSKKDKGKRVIAEIDLNNFLQIQVNVPGKKVPARSKGRTTMIAQPKLKKAGLGDLSEKQIDELVWSEIQKQLLRELAIEGKSPRLVKQALKCLKNPQVRKLLTRYMAGLEAELVASGKAQKWS